ncbi:metallophosphoesterase family protein [Phototrophicus methaneseepsis]|uniref:Metallophosphoesterase family protein n=1 Tax=Phototrophicus methaneseepsis TaxID=2710758 RepID=A0A7S8E936_9CHLR|nr:metallophosphoesterase family protein [Phototrophicus methaneseepsis]QPC82538.1 metallophosphoesterase family protein [Phototrophicus methaneseepsis]
MRLALISDVHGNALALEAVLAHLKSQSPDQLVCLGDVAANGANPMEALAMIEDLDCPVIMGNMDAFLLDNALYTEPDGIGAYYYHTSQWASEQLTEEARAFISRFTPYLSIYEHGVRVMCYHGTPHDFDEGILADTAADKLTDVFHDYEAQVYIGGHTHMPMLRRWGRKMILNPGSVGLAWQPDPAGSRPESYAEYAIIDINSVQDLQVQFFRLPYDVAAYHQQMRTSGLPHANWLINRWADA